MSNVEIASADNVAKRLIWLRTYLGLSQSAFAAAIGVPAQQLNNWERARNRLSLEGAMKINEIYGTTLDFIFLDRRHSLPYEMVVALNELDKSVEPEEASRKPATNASNDKPEATE